MLPVTTPKGLISPVDMTNAVVRRLYGDPPALPLRVAIDDGGARHMAVGAFAERENPEAFASLGRMKHHCFDRALQIVIDGFRHGGLIAQLTDGREVSATFWDSGAVFKTVQHIDGSAHVTNTVLDGTVLIEERHEPFWCDRQKFKAWLADLEVAPDPVIAIIDGRIAAAQDVGSSPVVPNAERDAWIRAYYKNHRTDTKKPPPLTIEADAKMHFKGRKIPKLRPAIKRLRPEKWGSRGPNARDTID